MIINRKFIDFKELGIDSQNHERKIQLSKEIYKNGLLLCFWPQDFQTESQEFILLINNKVDEIKSKNVNVIGISVDSIYSHKEFIQKIEKDTKIKFTWVSDITKNISRDYEVLIDNSVSCFALFYIDKNGIIQFVEMNSNYGQKNINNLINVIDEIIILKK